MGEQYAAPGASVAVADRVELRAHRRGVVQRLLAVEARPDDGQLGIEQREKIDVAVRVAEPQFQGRARLAAT